MAIISASNLKDAEELLYSGINKVALAYDINGDDFFRLACQWCQRGATLSKDSQYFVVSLKGFSIPPND